jgi:hypothetical protein
MRRGSWLSVLAAICLATPAQAVAPTADLHELDWYVHTDLIDAGAGWDLAYYEALLDDAMEEATALLEGNQGPADTPCCTRITRGVSVTTFGTTGDGLDVLDSAADYAAITAVGGSGSRAFLVDSLTYCSGPAPGAIGCGTLPTCNGDPNDDPDLWVVVTMDAFDDHNGVQTLAHERGHNSCLPHVNTDECQLMRPAAGGGCLGATECTNFQAGRTATGGSCTCHDSGTGILDDGLVCSDVAGGLCSGGICGAPTGPAAVQLMAAAGPGFGSGQTSDDPLLMSGLTAGWVDLGSFGTSGEVVEGLAYATDSSTLYGVVPSDTGDDFLVIIDPVTGAITSTPGTLANGTDKLVALAYDPGATNAPGDDLLIALESDGTFEDVVTIDPASPNTRSFIGALASGAADGFRGLAYDSAAGKLYTSSPFLDGIYEIDLSTCPFFCGLVAQAGLGLERFDSGLSYSPDTGMLHLVGSQTGVAPLGPRTLYDVIDPSSFVTTTSTIQVDAFTTAGLAALPVPEPASAAGLGAGLGALAALGRRRRRAHG